MDEVADVCTMHSAGPNGVAKRPQARWKARRLRIAQTAIAAMIRAIAMRGVAIAISSRSMMRVHYKCAHVRCRGCKVVWRVGGETWEVEPKRAVVGKGGVLLTVKVYFRCCRCGKLTPLTRTGNKHNNRTKLTKRQKDQRKSVHEQLRILPNDPIWFFGGGKS